MIQVVTLRFHFQYRERSQIHDKFLFPLQNIVMARGFVFLVLWSLVYLFVECFSEQQCKVRDFFSSRAIKAAYSARKFAALKMLLRCLALKEENNRLRVRVTRSSWQLYNELCSHEMTLKITKEHMFNHSYCLAYNKPAFLRCC